MYYLAAFRKWNEASEMPEAVWVAILTSGGAFTILIEMPCTQNLPLK
jgi:hypothetical protein